MAKQKGGSDIPGQEIVPQATRYTGSDVPGMEYTTARPMSYETGADPDVLQPEKPWPGTFCHYAQIKGKKVATRTEDRD